MWPSRSRARVAARDLPTGVVRTATGYRTFQWVPDPDRPNGRIRSKRWKADASIREMRAWREAQRVGGRRPGVAAPLWCYIYFVRAGDHIKIGRATDPAARVRDLQVAHAEDLSLLLSIPAHADLETALHERFDHLRRRGEWFRVDPDLTAFINAVQAGANPITLLLDPPCRADAN